MAINEKALTEDGLKKIADGLNLDTDEWWECTNSDEAKNKMTAAKLLAENLGIKYVPALFINNKQINLDDDLDIEDILNKSIAQ